MVRLLSGDHARIRLMAAGGLLLALSLACSPWDNAAAQQDGQSACQPDVFRLCNQYVPDRGPIIACLVRQKRNLSPACRAVMSQPRSGTRVGKRTGKRKTSHRRH
jgi:hypothetical protein